MAGYVMATQAPLHGPWIAITRARRVEGSPSPNQATVVATTQGITRLDAYLDGRPIQSVDVQSSPTTLSIAKPGTPPATLELRAFDGTELVGRYRTTL